MLQYNVERGGGEGELVENPECVDRRGRLQKNRWQQASDGLGRRDQAGQVFEEPRI